MGVNFKYISVPKKSINEEYFFKDRESRKEILICNNEFTPGSNFWTHESALFTDEFRIWLESFNCRIYRAESFKIFPGNKLAWHRDTNDDPEKDDLEITYSCKINFTWGDLQNSFIEYGELINPPFGEFATTSNRGRKTWIYREEAMKVIEQGNTGHPILINRGFPHRVNNAESDQPWVCLSCVIVSNTSDTPLSYHDALKIFESVCML